MKGPPDIHAVPDYGPPSYINLDPPSPSTLSPPSQHNHTTNFITTSHINTINHLHNSSTNNPVNQSRCLLDGVSGSLRDFLPSSSTQGADIVSATGESQNAYDQYQQTDQFDNQSSFGHEALAGAASFGAFKFVRSQKSLHL